MLLELLSRSFGLKYVKGYTLKTLFSGVYLEKKDINRRPKRHGKIA